MRTKQWLSYVLPMVLILVLITTLIFPIGLTKSSVKYVITVGTPIQASGVTPDYVGTTSTVVQQALDALPVSGGVIQLISATYTFDATVSRSINNVTIQGMNGTLITYTGSGAAFSVGSQTGWVFKDFSTAIGTTITNYDNALIQNVAIGTTLISYQVANSALPGSSRFYSIVAPTGRTATYVIAASDATAKEKAQADVTCPGFTGSSITNVGGVVTGSPLSLTSDVNILPITTAGTFKVKLPTSITGQIYAIYLPAGAVYTIPCTTLGYFSYTIPSTITGAKAYSGTAIVSGDSGSGVSLSGEASIRTMTTTGVFTIDVTTGSGTAIIRRGRESSGTVAQFTAPLVAGDNTITLYSATNHTLQLAGYDDVAIQAAINSLTTGGTVKFTSGSFHLSTPITIPWGLPFDFEGSGMPVMPYLGYSPTSLSNNGTLIKGSYAWSYGGVAKQLFIGGTSTYYFGNRTFKNMALCMPFRYVNNSVLLTCIKDLWAAQYELDNLLFVPTNWYENLPYQQSTASANTVGLQAFDIESTGGGANMRIGNIYIYGQGAESVIFQFDQVQANLIQLLYCKYGVSFGGIWENKINRLVMYGVNYHGVTFATNTHNNWIGSINWESLGSTISTTYMVSNGVLPCTIDYAYVFHISDNYDKYITTVTSDDSLLEKPCRVFNLGGTAITRFAPRSKAVAAPFGDTLAAPFKTTTIGAVSGGSASPTTGTTYKANIPVDVTITAGGGDMSITTKDAAGTTIDNAVTSLSHRLLLPYYTIICTYTTGTPTFAIVQATIGDSDTTTGASTPTATPIAGVNYVVYKRAFFVSIVANSGFSVTTYDGSTNAGGVAMDTSLASMARYLLEPGQIIVLTGTPGTITVMSQ